MVTISSATNRNELNTIQKLAYNIWPTAYSHILSKQQLEYMLSLYYSIDALQSQLNNGHLFYIAQTNKEAVGFASCSLIDNAILKLQKLYVLPSTQHLGIGKQLLQTVTQYGLQHNCTTIQLNVNRYNSAIEFYKKNGYAITHTVDIAIGNNYYMNDYIMEKSLVF